MPNNKSMHEHDNLILKPAVRDGLSDFDPASEFGIEDSKRGHAILKENRKKIQDLTDMLNALKKHGVLIVLQGMDASGKDSAMKHVFRRVRPQITRMTDFKEPTNLEKRQDFLRKAFLNLPNRGEIGIFNRSYYEEVVTTRVHPEYIVKQGLPGIGSADDMGEEFWDARFNSINNLEEYLSRNGFIILKFYMNLSHDKQKDRFLRRIRRPDKHWKFEYKDIQERGYWDEYMHYYEQAFQKTSTFYAPWHVIPADKKWVSRALISDILVSTLEKVSLRYPIAPEQKQVQMKEAKIQLKSQ